ncbi:MAG: F0F1 ATP synthase subunit epsilon [Chloroflexi bacterium]|nr:F0F1 ATP synthase subunit epsilon [Chloroflexota bacterium]
MPIRCEIVTQERLLYSEDVDMVIAPGSDGELGILPHHAPLLTSLAYGELRLKKGGGEESFAIGGGILEVTPDKVTVLADSAERAEEIDLSRAEEARRRAEEMLSAGPPADEDSLAALDAALRRSNIRLKVAHKRAGRARPGAMEMQQH